MFVGSDQLWPLDVTIDTIMVDFVKGGSAVVVAHAYRPDGSHTAVELWELSRDGLPRGLYAAVNYDGSETNVNRVDRIMGKELLRVIGSNGLAITI